MILVSEADTSESEKMTLRSVGLLLARRVAPCSCRAGRISSETRIVITVAIARVCSLGFSMRHLAFQCLQLQTQQPMHNPSGDIKEGGSMVAEACFAVTWVPCIRPSGLLLLYLPCVESGGLIVCGNP